MLLFALLIPVTLFARTLDPVFRDCMRQAVETYQSALIDAQREHDGALVSAMEQRKQTYVDSWTNEDDRAQRDQQRAADREFSARRSDARTVQRTHEKDASKNYNNAQRTCRASSSSSSSRSSSSSSVRSSSSVSSYSSGYSSSSQTQMCKDIVCSDGRRFPTCINGYPLKYFVNPCLYSN